MSQFREVTIGPCRLINADCMDVLPTLDPSLFDSLITDPVWPNAPAGMFDMDCTPRELLFRCLDAVDCKRLAIIMRTDSDPRILMAVPSRFRFIRHQNLEYVATGYLGRVLGGMEVVYGFGDPIKSAEGRRVIPGNSTRVQPLKEHERVDHPCPRHPDHMAFVVKWWSDPRETVLDPFMGTATVGAACVQSERRFIGIEKEPKYFDIACDRIQRAWDLKCSELPFEKPQPLKQRELLGIDG